MKRIMIFFAAAFAVVCCLSACGASYSVYKYTGTGVDSSLSTGDVRKARVGDRIQVSLESNPTTGYTWVYATPLDTSIIIPTGESVTRKEADEELCGAPSVHNFFYKVIAPGECGINLEYVRPWMKDGKAERRFSILVKAEGKAENPPPVQKSRKRVVTDLSGGTVTVDDNLLK